MIPQGSVLDPILFIIPFIMYINSLCDMNIDEKIPIYFSSINWDSLRQKTELNYNKVIK